ncbi:hypothetical protein [Nodularia sp. UHCC 0506]|uniref:hypothetical protein n=1 Tax=Nodularia sp. UHCC 0506 TaxID=3110243 RepID=UPI002B1E9443|nr:hypothetical protein [Nodularia sp. UHCC 0506]MEA5513155.1 hypothetical protein [Nodularia sp. UHCC 0506]
MGRWTPLILMAGGLAILLGTLLGINFPMGGQQTASNDAPDGKTSKVLPANINVNSSAPSRNANNETAPESSGSVAQDSFSTSENNRGSVAQESFSTSENNRGSVAQSNDSFSRSDTTTTSETRSTGFASGTTTSTSTNNQGRSPIRALW